MPNNDINPDSRKSAAPFVTSLLAVGHGEPRAATTRECGTHFLSRLLWSNQNLPNNPLSDILRSVLKEPVQLVVSY